MIPPKKFSTIAKKYTPDLLNKWLDALIRQNSYYRFLSFKNELLAAENHPEWFFKLLNFSNSYKNTLSEFKNIWNDFIKICKKEDTNFTVDFSGCTFKMKKNVIFLVNKKIKIFWRYHNKP